MLVSTKVEFATKNMVQFLFSYLIGDVCVLNKQYSVNSKIQYPQIKFQPFSLSTNSTSSILLKISYFKEIHQLRVQKERNKIFYTVWTQEMDYSSSEGRMEITFYVLTHTFR